jgi:hypothetical protein
MIILLGGNSRGRLSVVGVLGNTNEALYPVGGGSPKWMPTKLNENHSLVHHGSIHTLVIHSFHNSFPMQRFEKSVVPSPGWRCLAPATHSNLQKDQETECSTLDRKT